MPIQPGARLGPYEVLEPIGAGGTGVVYRARHVKLRRNVAVKVLTAEFSADRAHLARFERCITRARGTPGPRSLRAACDASEARGCQYAGRDPCCSRWRRRPVGA